MITVNYAYGDRSTAGGFRKSTIDLSISPFLNSAMNCFPHGDFIFEYNDGLTIHSVKVTCIGPRAHYYTSLTSGSVRVGGIDGYSLRLRIIEDIKSKLKAVPVQYPKAPKFPRPRQVSKELGSDYCGSFLERSAIHK